MEINIDIPEETKIEIQKKPIRRLFNPGGLDHLKQLRVKSIELSDEFTRIDFLYQIPQDGWWVSMEPTCYIQVKGSKLKHRLIKAVGIPLKPKIATYWKRQTISYTLFFTVLPSNTTSIDIIEKLAPGNYFNFFDVCYKKWMTVPHPTDIKRSNN
jgi:hypothetical protein